MTIDRCFRLQLCQNISDLQGLRFLRIYNTRSQRLNLKQLNKLVVLGFKNCDIQNAIIPSGIKELLVVNSVIQQQLFLKQQDIVTLISDSVIFSHYNWLRSWEFCSSDDDGDYFQMKQVVKQFQCMPRLRSFKIQYWRKEVDAEKVCIRKPSYMEILVDEVCLAQHTILNN